MNPLPVPEKPYASWAEFVRALWVWGLMHTDRAVLDRWLTHAVGEMTKPRDPMDGRLLRPSSGLNCSMKTALTLEGFPAEAPRPELNPTFNVGHLLHAHAFAQVESALPEGFEMVAEKTVDLTTLDWWPKDPAVAKQTGSADLLLCAPDSVYLERYFVSEPEVPLWALVDFKTSADHNWKQARQVRCLTEKPDTFGYFSQVAVYREALGMRDCETVIAYINRNILSLKAPVAARTIPSDFLDDEVDRVRERVTGGAQPSAELSEAWGSQVDWYCGRGGKEGMCEHRAECLRRTESVDV